MKSSIYWIILLALILILTFLFGDVLFFFLMFLLIISLILALSFRRYFNIQKKPVSDIEKPIIEEKTDKLETTEIQKNKTVEDKMEMRGIFIIMIGVVIIIGSLLFWFYSGDLSLYSGMNFNIEQMRMWTNIRVMVSPVISIIGIIIVIIGIKRWDKEIKEKDRQ
ncbi:hypothetical protein ACFL1L_04260 [Thermoplasmatota archaeon]